MRFNELIGESPTLVFAQAARERKKRGEAIISLGLGEPDFRTPDHIIKATVQALNQEKYGKYSSPNGIIELREAIAEKLQIENGIVTAPNNIIITPGAKQAFVLALMALLEPGDEVINISPSYVSYIPGIKIAEPGAIIRNVVLNQKDLSLDFEELHRSLSERTKVIIINSPHNPTGKMYSLAELIGIAEFARNHNIYVLSDEVYELLNFSGDRHYSIASFDGMDDLVITINGFSKSFAMTGWRIGYMCLPTQLIDKASKLQQHINTNTCTFIQPGALAAIKGPKKHISDYNKELRKRVGLFNDFIGRSSKISAFNSQGGFFGFINISGTAFSHSNDFCAELIKETGVAMTPGIAFGKEWDNFVRISFAVDRDELEKALNMLEKFLNK